MPYMIYKLISTTVNLLDSEQQTKDTASSDFVNENQDFLVNSSIVVNDTSANSTYVPYEKRPETYVIPIIFSIIFLLGEREFICLSNSFNSFNSSNESNLERTLRGLFHFKNRRFVLSHSFIFAVECLRSKNLLLKCHVCFFYSGMGSAVHSN